MGFIKWIKKELKATSSHNRRESAPAYISNDFDPNLARDEAYLKALTTFNEWRTNQRMERLSREPQNKTPAEVLDEIAAKPETQIDENLNNFKNFEEFKMNQTLYENSINLEAKRSRKENRRMRRYSPPYQTVVNKHGDVVEYAMPYSEPDPPVAASSADTLTSVYSEIRNIGDVPIVIVTDLDKSVDSRATLLSPPPPSIDHQQQEELIKWDSPWRNESSSQHHSKTNGILIAEPNENWFRTNVFHSPCLPMLEFSKGIFRNTEVGFRTNKIISKDSVFVSKYALQRDMDILNSIRQTNITMLMAISYDDYDEFKRMSLILEPFDCTINHFLYEMNQQFSVVQIIKIMQQISGAVIYLHECGYIHSNISTNSILITKYQTIYIAKLSNFELTTEQNYQNIQNDIKTLYQSSTSGGTTEKYYAKVDQLGNTSEYIILLKNVQRNLKEQYYELSRNKNLIVQSNQNGQVDNFSRFNGKIGRKYYPYYVEYRKLFSLYYYQSPELMSSNVEFVFPTKSTDIYQMTLLLWEILNSCIPFVIFNEAEMDKLYSSNLQCSILNNFSENCKYFDKILKYGLQIQLRKRIMTVKHLKLLLDNVEIELIKEGILEEEKTFVTPVRSDSNARSDNTSHFASFNQFLASKPPDTYDRTSTLKKRIKKQEEQPKKSVRELFNNLHDELDMISDDVKFNKSDIMKEFDFTGVEKEDLVDIQENVETDFSTPPKPVCRNTSADSYSLIDLSFPDTPIARKNKLRKQAWLNGYRYSVKPSISSDNSESDDEQPKRISVHEAVAKIENRNIKSKLESPHSRNISSKYYSPSKPLIEFTPPQTPSILTGAPPAPITPLRKTALCKKITTRVTLNFRKSSQSPIIPQANETNLSNYQPPVTLQRHSISGKEIMQLMQRQKIHQNMTDLLFCNNCHSQIKHSNILGMLSGQMNLSQIDSFRSSDASNMLRLDKKSTEDLYIDDDFCQGINLGANMELITIDTNEDDFLNMLNFDLFASNENGEEKVEDTDNVNDNQNE